MKKGGKNKSSKNKISNEEKKYLEKKLYRKTKKCDLEREIATQNKKRDEIENFWMKVSLKIKIPIIRQQVEVEWHVFLRAIDKKDCFINELYSQVKGSEMQQRMTSTVSFDISAKMLSEFLEFVSSMGEAHTSDVSALLSRGANDRRQAQQLRVSAERRAALLAFTVTDDYQHQAEELRGQAFVRHSEKNKMLNDLSEKMLQSIERDSNVWTKYNQVLKQYLEKILQTKTRYNKLKEKDSLMRKIISKQEKQRFINIDIIDKLRSDMQMYESGSVMHDISVKFNLKKNAYSKAKEELAGDSAKDWTQFKDLVEESNKSIKWLEDVVSKGQKVLTAARLCQSLLTSSEMALWLTDEKNAFIFPPCEGAESCVKDETFPTRNSSDIQWFWTQVAQANISKACLMTEKRKLQANNLDLRQRIKDLKTSVQEELPEKQNIITGTLSIVEAAHIYKNNKLL